MSEKTLYNKVKRYLPGTVSRVENLCDPGMPDVSGSCEKGDYWVELKAPGLAHPASDPTYLLNEHQLPWTRRRLRFGARVFMLVQNKRSITLFKAGLIKNKLYYILIYLCKGPLRKERAVEFTSAILTYLPTRGV